MTKQQSSPSPERIVHLLNQPQYQPLTQKQIADKLKIKGPQRETFLQVMRKLELDGTIARIKQDRWVLSEEAGLVTGVIQFNQKGFAFVVPEGGGDEVFVPAEDAGVALHQDLVVVRLERGKSGDRKTQGRVIRIQKRRHEKLVGTLQQTDLFHIVVPDDPRFIHNIYVPKTPATANNEPVEVAIGDKVVVKLLEWKSRHENPEGIIIERLGKTGEAGVDILSIIRKFDLSTEFPTEVLAEVTRLEPPEKLDKGRQDLREEYIITIDPDTAKDFDDAISLTPVGKGVWEVGIHIADVSHYVKPGTLLDEEARRRGNSTYLVNQVIPMLPEELSNGLCSLVPDEDRYAFSVFVRLDQKGKIIACDFAKSLIRSKHRLTYKQAFERLCRKPQDVLDEFLHEAWRIASTLRKNRFQQGALEMDFPETKVYLDDHGVPIRLEKVDNDISHQLIEEFMLLANEQVARILKNQAVPTLYRAHDAPTKVRLNEYREMLAMRGIKCGNLAQRNELQRVLSVVSKRPDAYILKLALLKSLKRADYRPAPIGHFGLAKTDYLHFTSPIRRYADLVAHRGLESLLYSMKRPSVDSLVELGRLLSATERTSAEAEIESVRLKTLEFFAIQLKKSETGIFEARITEVMQYGFFVELIEFAVSGLVHLSFVKDDFYFFDEYRQTLKGKRKGHIFQPGQMLKVKVSNIDMFKKQIDFVPA